MEAEAVDPQNDEDVTQDSSENDPSEEVAETTAPLHFEGKGLDKEIEKRHENQ